MHKAVPSTFSTPMDQILITQQNELLSRIATALEAMSGKSQEAGTLRLGFAGLPNPRKYRYIYANRDGDRLWYMLSEEPNPRTGKRSKIAVEHESIIGKLLNIEIVLLKRRDKNQQEKLVPKAHLILEADEPTVIECGHESNFFRAFVAIASNLSDEKLAGALQIIPDPENAQIEKIMWCKVFDPVSRTYCKRPDWWRKENLINWAKIIDDLIVRLRHLRSISATGGTMASPSTWERDAATTDEDDDGQSSPVTQNQQVTLSQPSDSVGIVDQIQVRLRRAQSAADVQAIANWINESPQREQIAEVPHTISWIDGELKKAYTKFAKANPVIDLSDEIAQTTVELRRLKWNNVKGREYLEQTYSKRSRQQLTDTELMDFLQYLQAQPTPVEAPV